ncbi:terpene synthase family protein [Streptosporangium saharense]|uniref:terpene synthase family protein n=1 Tax=Streptosporangium saharense TaxID=1706840 RepID=UPI0033201597
MRTRPNATSREIPLRERLAALSAPCPVHPSAHRIEAAVIDWARRTGLDADPAQGVHRLAGRAFARHDTGTATLFARWLTLLTRLRREPSALPGVLAVAGGCEPGPAPVERAFADLWEACAPTMSDGWRERFVAGLAVPDATGFGRRLLDLAEPCLGVEVPAPLQESRRWRATTEAGGDVVTWCDALLTGHLPLPSARTAEVSEVSEVSDRAVHAPVIDRVVERMEELWSAARALPPLVGRHDLGLDASREVIQVACAFLTIPRAYLEGLLESRRYRHLE